MKWEGKNSENSILEWLSELVYLSKLLGKQIVLISFFFPDTCLNVVHYFWFKMSDTAHIFLDWCFLTVEEFKDMPAQIHDCSHIAFL